MSKSANQVGKKKLNIKEKLDEDNLDLSLCSLDKVPVKEIAEITKVKKLNLSFNQLVILPLDFVKLQNIRELDLSKNHLRFLPENFGSMINLKSLDLLGNELTTLPTSFSELKSLQWLDLKDNPLDPELRKVVGECGDETQCKKCAVNVIKYMKQIASEEERKRQLELKKKKDEHARKEAEEKEKEKQLKLIKKQEKEQKRLENELKRKELKQKNEEIKEASFKEEKAVLEENKSRSGFCKILFSAVSYIFMLLLVFLGLFVLFSNYCDQTKELNSQVKNLLNYQHVKPVLQYLDQNLCPIINVNKIPIQKFLKNLQQQINI